MISIIVPAYNAEKYIERTIGSLLEQTYDDLEIVCVNDGSFDGTLELLKELSSRDKRIKILDKANEGVTMARRFGFEHSGGEFIGFVDSDDTVEPNMFEQLINNAEKNNTEISHCGYDVIGLNGEKTYFYNTGKFAVQNKTDGLKSLIEGKIEPALCNKLYRRELLENLFHSGVMDYSIKINEDLLMNYYLFKNAEKTVFEDVCLYHYLKREGSASTSGISKNYIWDQINVKKIILEDSQGTDYVEAAKKAFILRLVHSYNSLIGVKDYDSDRREIRRMISDNKELINVLEDKYKTLAKMILNTPAIYHAVYKITSK